MTMHTAPDFMSSRREDQDVPASESRRQSRAMIHIFNNIDNVQEQEPSEAVDTTRMTPSLEPHVVNNIDHYGNAGINHIKSQQDSCILSSPGADNNNSASLKMNKSMRKPRPTHQESLYDCLEQNRQDSIMAGELSLLEKMAALTTSVRNKYENILVEPDNKIQYTNYNKNPNRQLLARKLSGLKNNYYSQVKIKKKQNNEQGLNLNV